MFQLPPRSEDNLAFRDIYLMDLGEGLNEQQFDDAADKVATYLYLDTTTGAGTFSGLVAMRSRESNAECEIRRAHSDCTNSVACRTTSWRSRSNTCAATRSIGG